MPEAYDQLSHKTYRMLRWCSRELRTKQLIKLDLTCMRYRGKQRIDPTAVATWLKGRLEEPLMNNPITTGFCTMPSLCRTTSTNGAAIKA
jgi:hypothetical protein